MTGYIMTNDYRFTWLVLLAEQVVQQQCVIQSGGILQHPSYQTDTQSYMVI